MEQTVLEQEISKLSDGTVILLIAGIFVCALLVNFILRWWFERIAKKTPTFVDDIAVKAIRKPLFWTLILAGTAIATVPIELLDGLHIVVNKVLLSIILLLWTRAGISFAKQVLENYEKNLGDKPAGQLLGRAEFLGNLAVVGLYAIGIVLILLVWGINLSPLLTSAGIFAAALTFATQDAISNLVGGMSILATEPYKLGDFIELDGGQYRGEVVEIGVYNTRVRTRDRVLITIPNSVMITDAVVNETGFSARLRIRIPMAVAYGSDLEKVEQVLLDVAGKRGDILQSPAPIVRYKEFGDGSIRVELRVVISNPANKGRITHFLIKDIEKRFKEENIAIAPPSETKVYLENNKPEK